MKIKHLKEHDEIVQWILDNPETFFKNLGLDGPFTDLKKYSQVNVLNGRTIIGTFDVDLRYQLPDDFIDPFSKTDKDGQSSEKKTGFMKRFLSVNIIVNVKMESATEQLREFKKIYFQDKENSQQHTLYKNWYVMVSTNDTFKSFFTDNNFIFYKY